MERIAVTLPGGGARSAYQAGVLRAIAEITSLQTNPFKIISGISAGAINGMWLAAEADHFQQATIDMWEGWKNLTVNDIYKTDPLTLFRTGTKLIGDLSLGGFGSNHINYLLNTMPLAHLLKHKINFRDTRKNIENGLIYGLSLTATDYQMSKAVSFFDGNMSIKPWTKTLSSGQREKLTIKHLLASCAIPIFFSPIAIAGRDYGDGGLGLKSPLSPAIHMGASRILVIGVQNPKTVISEKRETKNRHVTLGDIAGSLLNSLFLNSLDADIARFERINRTVSMFSSQQLKKEVDKLRKIPLLVIRPSRDLSDVGVKQFSEFPYTIRHLLKGLGITSQRGWDLLSYLAFDKTYSEALLNLGYEDAMRMKEEILNWMEGVK